MHHGLFTHGSVDGVHGEDRLRPSAQEAPALLITLVLEQERECIGLFNCAEIECVHAATVVCVGDQANPDQWLKDHQWFSVHA